jgi:hypothetical protein
MFVPPVVSLPCHGGEDCDPMISRAMLMVALLLVGSPRPERSRVRFQTKKDTLVLQVGDWALGVHPNPVKKQVCWEHNTTEFITRQENLNIMKIKNKQRPSGMEKDCVGTQRQQQTGGGGGVNVCKVRNGCIEGTFCYLHSDRIITSRILGWNNYVWHGEIQEMYTEHI